MKTPRKKKSNDRDAEKFQYDVCLSFAGEDRTYVDSVANYLVAKGVRVFYDKYETVELWGKDLYSHLADIYEHAARYCVLFISKHYALKVWTNHERRSAQARAFSENREYILPARFDRTEIPGLPATVGYINLHNLRPKKFAALIIQKLGPRPNMNFLPPVLDRLYKRLGATRDAEKDRIVSVASSFFRAFTRMSADERRVISAIFLHGCPTELPANIHINLDLLRRVTEFPPNKVKRILGNLRSLGFTSTLRVGGSNGHEDSLGDTTLLVVNFDALSLDVEPNDDHTEIAEEMVLGAVEDFCAECGPRALMSADFSQLASATTTKEIHKRKRLAAVTRNSISE
jgi:hypothetical protein